MKKLLKIIFRWLSRLLIGLVGLVVLVLVLFMALRGVITDRALNYVNSLQPGKVQVERMTLRPFMNFPDISLQLKEIGYNPPLINDSIIDQPVLELEDIYVSLDILQLLKKSYRVSKIRFADGIIRYHVGADSVSNIEQAIGIRFDESAKDTAAKEEMPAISLDIESVEMRNVRLEYVDRRDSSFIEGIIHGLETEFSYTADAINTRLMMHAGLGEGKISKLRLSRPREISFSSGLNYMRESKQLSLEQSALDLDNALLQLGGNIDFSEDTLDLDFNAVNSDINLLNFLLSGVLNLTAIEQVGEGTIRLEGGATGSFKDGLPLLNLSFAASDMGFRIHSINQSVTGIRFEGFATNGTKEDFSEAAIRLSGFHVDFPDGSLDADIALENMKYPKAKVNMTGKVDLRLIDEIIASEKISELAGTILLDGDVEGQINRSGNLFLENSGTLKASLNNVAMKVPDHALNNLHGELLIQGRLLTLKGIRAIVDSTELQFDGRVREVLPYIAGFPVAPSLDLHFSTPEIRLSEFFANDSSQLPELKNVSANIEVETNKGLRKSLSQKEIPELDLVIDDLSMEPVGYAPIRNVGLKFAIDSDTLRLRLLKFRAGDTDMNGNLVTSGYKGILKKDSIVPLSVDLDLSSRLLRFSDLLVMNDTFRILPPELEPEELRNMSIKLNMKANYLKGLESSSLNDILVNTRNIRFAPLHYTNAIKKLSFQLEKKDSVLNISNLMGQIGPNDIGLDVALVIPPDSTRPMSGNLSVHSEYLDVEGLAAYALFAKESPAKDSLAADSSGNKLPDLEGVNLPDISLDLDLKELKVGKNTFRNMNGRISVKPYKHILFEPFSLQTVNGGALRLDGYMSLANPEMMTLSTNIKIDTVNISDFEVQMAIGDSIYSLEENFNGVLSASGLAEVFIDEDLSVNTDYSTAMLYVTLENGRIRNFAPLQALAGHLGYKEMNNLKFGRLTNPRGFTLADGTINVPLMSIETNVGLILLEGEQQLNGDFLYLARVPSSMARGTAWNMLASPPKKETGDEIQQMRAQKFMVLTLAGRDGKIEVKVGDKRDQYR